MRKTRAELDRELRRMLEGPGDPEDSIDSAVEAVDSAATAVESIRNEALSSEPVESLGPVSDAAAGQAAPEAAPEAATEAAPDRAAEVAPEAATEAAPDRATDTTAEAAPDSATEAAPEAAPEPAPDAATDAAPEAAPDAATDAAPEAASDGATETAAEVAPEAATETTAEVASEAASDAAPEPAPEAACDAAPEPAPEAAPEADALLEAAPEAETDQGPLDADAQVPARPAVASAAELDPVRSARARALLESLLFAAVEPLSLRRLEELLDDLDPPLSQRAIRELLDELRDELRESGRGTRVFEVAQGYQLRTPSEASPYVRKLVATRPPRLTQATLETLAIVAYRQPITRPEIESIRGVDCGAVLKHLMERRLVKVLGRKDEVGKPLIYGTTPEFLEFFSLRDLRSLPTLKDYVELSAEHRAQLGLAPLAPVLERETEAEGQATFSFSVAATESYTPVGEDEVLEELTGALDEMKAQGRRLRELGVIRGEEEAEPAVLSDEAGPLIDEAGSLIDEAVSPAPPEGEAAPGESDG